MPTKTCACKGIRTCLQCDSNIVNSSKNTDELSTTTTTSSLESSTLEYIYCWKCGNRAVISSEFDEHFNSSNHYSNSENEISFTNQQSISIDGVFLQEAILTADEELELIASIDSREWVDSQSGRRKQDFGPKINFKKKKVNFTPFQGLPELDMRLLERIQDGGRLRSDLKAAEKFADSEQQCKQQSFEQSDESKMNNQSVLRNFKTVEVCHLEYCPERGSSIDPHFDDFWIWGERLVTLNLASETVITLSLRDDHSHCIRVRLPARSILVLYGDARHRYEHSIQRRDITSRRLAITYRELPGAFLRPQSEEYQRIGREFLERAEQRI